MEPPDHLDTPPAGTSLTDTLPADTPPARTLPATVQRSTGLDPARIQEVTGGRYRAVRMLGAGGLGSVFKAVDTMLERPVAIKMLRSGFDRVASQRFLREAQAMARVHGVHVLRIYELGIGAGDVPFIVMELVDGSLAELMRLDGPVDPRVATEVVRQVATGLKSLHDHVLPSRLDDALRVVFTQGS